MNSTDISKIIKEALRTRIERDIQLDESFCIFDLAHDLGAEVRFVALSSMEGAYFKDTKSILLSTLRPEGRIRFTCAHELGHYVFGHGDHFDELVEKANLSCGKDEESMANIFASFLLMPETTVRNYFFKNCWPIKNLTPVQLYKTSNWLGVSYLSIVSHIYYGLNMIDKTHYEKLKLVTVKSLKKDIAQEQLDSNLFVINKHWNGRPIDLQVNDVIIFEEEIECENDLIINNNTKLNIYRATKPGLSRIKFLQSGTFHTLRIRREQYTGRSIFRHLDEE